jgi:predicted Ser/Thr protein kinase
VDAAIGMQRTLADANAQTRKAEEKLHIRIGVNYGTALINDKDGDIFGDMVNVAARIQAKAGDDQIFASETVVKNISPSVQTRVSGEFTLKGKTQTFQLHEVDWRSNRTGEVIAPPKLDKRYVVLKKLGAGGMASVWRARDERLGRDVAIKVIHPHLASEPARQRFEREAQIAAGLNHESIVQVYDYSSSDTYDSFIAMELVEGSPLRDHLEKKGPLGNALTAAIGYQVARALAYAHGRGVIHRDVKPENVLLSREGQVKLGDFGIAGVGDTVRQTTAGMVMGTAAYLAPEQVQGKTADARSDLYALGVMLYECVTGKEAFIGNTPAALMYAIVENKYQRPEFYEGVDGKLAGVINRCLAKDPKKRFQSGEELAQALKPIVAKGGVEDITASVREYARKAPEENQRAAAPRSTAKLKQSRARLFAALKERKWLVASAGAGVLLIATAAAVVLRPAHPVRAGEPAPVPVEAAAPAAKVEPAPVPSPPKPSILHVIAHRGFVNVAVDGRLLGRPPYQNDFPLPPGDHTVVMTNGSGSWSKTAHLDAHDGLPLQLEVTVGLK